MSTAPAVAAAAPNRRYDLDWLRIFAFALLVLFHVGMYYVSWDWHVKSAHASAALEPWLLLSVPWRMDLLFLVSGAATSLMLVARAADGAWLRRRSARLLLPLLAGMLVLVPPQPYFEVLQFHGYRGSYLEFLGLYFSGERGFCRASGACLMLPTWNHLWFLPYVAAYTAGLWWWLRRQPDGLGRVGEALTRHLRGARLLVLPVLVFALLRVLLRDRFPPSHALVDDWYLHARYLLVFGFGAVLARAPALSDAMARWRRVALLLALAAWGLGRVAPDDVAGTAWSYAWPFVAASMQWFALVAALGFARVHLNFDHRWRRGLNEAVFPLYVLHQTITIVAARWLAPWALAPALEAALLVILTFGIGALAVVGLRHLAWLRPWLGMAPIVRGDAARRGGTPQADDEKRKPAQA